MSQQVFEMRSRDVRCETHLCRIEGAGRVAAHVAAVWRHDGARGRGHDRVELKDNKHALEVAARKTLAIRK